MYAGRNRYRQKTNGRQSLAMLINATRLMRTRMEAQRAACDGIAESENEEQKLNHYSLIEFIQCNARLSVSHIFVLGVGEESGCCVMAVAPEPPSEGDANRPSVSPEGERSIGLPAGERNDGGTAFIGDDDSTASDVL